MKTKKAFLMTAIVTVLVLGLATVSLAATEWKTPAEILAGLTGQSVEAVREQRNDGASYGAQAAEADVLEAFRNEHLAQVKIRLDEAVAAGQMEKEEADDRYAALADRAENCDGSGTYQGEGGLRMGSGGQGSGNGNGGMTRRGGMAGRGGQSGADCPLANE